SEYLRRFPRFKTYLGTRLGKLAKGAEPLRRKSFPSQQQPACLTALDPEATTPPKAVSQRDIPTTPPAASSRSSVNAAQPKIEAQPIRKPNSELSTWPSVPG